MASSGLLKDRPSPQGIDHTFGKNIKLFGKIALLRDTTHEYIRAFNQKEYALLILTTLLFVMIS